MEMVEQAGVEYAYLNGPVIMWSGILDPEFLTSTCQSEYFPLFVTTLVVFILLNQAIYSLNLLAWPNGFCSYVTHPVPPKQARVNQVAYREPLVCLRSFVPPSLTDQFHIQSKYSNVVASLYGLALLPRANPLYTNLMNVLTVFLPKFWCIVVLICLVNLLHQVLIHLFRFIFFPYDSFLILVISSR